MATPPQQEELDWREMLKESTWVTIAWEWLQKLLGRSVDLVLWVTMIFSGYQLIPGAPQPPANISISMFVLQFIALDVGGLGLNQLGQRQGLDRWAYARVVAYVLIGITLITITYSGIHHAIQNIPGNVNTDIEVALVVARSVMTVLYGQAIRSLKQVERSTRDHLAELEALVPDLRQQLDTVCFSVSSLRQQLSGLQQQIDTDQSHLSILRGHLENRQTEVESGQSLLTGVRTQVQELTTQLNQVSREKQELVRQVNRSQLEVSDLTSKLEQAQQQVRSLTSKVQEMTSSSAGQKEITSKRSQVKSHNRSEQGTANGSPGTVLQLVPKQGEGRTKHDPREVKAWCEAHANLTQAEQAAQLGISDAANLRRLLRRVRDLEDTTGHAAHNG